MQHPLHELPTQVADPTQAAVINEVNDANPNPVKDVINQTLTVQGIAGSLLMGGLAAKKGHDDLKAFADSALAYSVEQSTGISKIPDKFRPNPIPYVEAHKAMMAESALPNGEMFPAHLHNFNVHANGVNLLTTVKPEVLEAEHHIKQLAMMDTSHLKNFVGRPAAIMAIGSLLSSGIYHAGKKVYDTYKGNPEDDMKEASDMSINVEDVLSNYATLAKVASLMGGVEQKVSNMKDIGSKFSPKTEDLTAKATAAVAGAIDKAKEMGPEIEEKLKAVASTAVETVKGVDANLVNTIKNNPRVAVTGAALAAGAVGSVHSDKKSRSKYASAMNIPEPMFKEAGTDDMTLIKDALSGK